jgi:predicted DNA-binding transcriptional regulator YafY
MAYKHDYDKILTRLTIILSRLNDGEALSVTELAKEFNVSERTIQRDFNERLISFPVYQEKKKWKMQEGFKLEKSTSIEDAVVLDIMEKLIEGAGRTFSMKAERLLFKIKNQSFNPFYAKLDMEDIGDKLKEVQQLESAIRNKEQISCLYRFESFSKTIDLKPLKIANYEGFWYLIALDARNDILKKYYLKNIGQITPKGESFTTESSLDSLLENAISVWFEKDVTPYRVTLELSPEVAKYFRRKPISKTQRTEELREDGSMVVSVEITNDMESVPIVKYWIPYIVVVHPKHLAERVCEDLSVFRKRCEVQQG